MARTLTVDELVARRAGPANHAFIDVQEKGEFNLGQIAGASPVPRGDFEWRIGELVPHRATPLVLYCSDGRRSALAAETAERLGYQDVAYLAGGLDAWRAAGQPVVEGWGVPGKDYGEKVSVVEEIPQITPEELVARQQQGERFVILDSRTIPEYEASHLPGAYAVPGGQLPLEVLDLIGEGDPTVVVNCAGRTRSILGAQLLRRMGLPKVMAFKNGTMAWHMAGFKLERGPDPRSDRSPSEKSRAAADAFADRVAAGERIPAVTPAQLQALQQSGELHYLIDVRLPAEYEAGHIPGAVSCQAGQLALLSEQIVGVRGAPIVMTCDARSRAILAASLYLRMGFPRVSFLDGGTTAWVAAGLPLATDPAPRHVPGLAEARARVKSVRPADLERSLAGSNPPVVLDVRGSGDYALGHLPGAHWLSRSYLELRVGDLAPDRSRPVVTVDTDGVRAVLSAARLLDLGYQDVAALEGGVPAWQTAGRPLEEGLANTPATLEQAKGDVDPFHRRGILARSEADMIAYLTWEEDLGKKYETAH